MNFEKFPLRGGGKRRIEENFLSKGDAADKPQIGEKFERLLPINELRDKIKSMELELGRLRLELSDLEKEERIKAPLNPEEKDFGEFKEFNIIIPKPEKESPSENNYIPRDEDGNPIFPETKE